MWRQPIGLGYASFVVADGRAFTIEQRRQQEVVAAYDVETGREVWTNGWEGEFIEGMGGDGPRATPTYHDGRVYALGALGELRCLIARTGALVWRRNILAENDAPNLTWGMSAAPLIVDENVVVLPGGSAGKSVVAYNKMTGEPAWKALDDRQAYTSPMLVDARRRAPDSGRERVSGDGPDGRRRARALGISLVHSNGHQRGAAAAARQRSRVPLSGLWPRRGGHRGERRPAVALPRARSGRTSG